jgi:hypothetical protein
VTYARPAPIAPSQSRYEAPDGILVYLINQTVNGSPERRLAAEFVLDCLRSYRTREETAMCLDELEDHVLLDIATDARALASSLGLIA